MDVITETSLEALLQRATDYRNKSTDTAAIDAFCGIIKKEPEGPLIASRLIASKIQSQEEWEALQGLTVLETCMKNCGSSFHSEIGKFRFLNEMIKLVSPKFLGPRTPASVRNQVLKMMHSWTLIYPKEHKIKEAYDMLIKQGVIQKGDISAEEDSISSLTQLPQKESQIFQDEEKVRLLQKLLHSKNPNDLQAANKLIKTMVREDEKRVEIKSKRISEVERVRNNVRLLSEMLESYRPNHSSAEELELIKELHQSCETLKPGIVRIASEMQDKDEFINQVISVGEELNQILEKYKEIIMQERNSNEVSHFTGESRQASALLDLSTPIEEFVPLTKEKNENSTDILSQLISDSGVGFKIPLESTTPSPLDNSGPVIGKNETSLHVLGGVFSSLNLQNNSAGPSFVQPLEHQQLPEKVEPAEKSRKSKALEELNVLGEKLLQQCKINALSKKSNPETLIFTSPKELENAKSTCEGEITNKLIPEEDDKLMDITDKKAPSLSINDSDILKSVTEPLPSPKKGIKPLADIFVSLESIKPSSVPPINVIEEKNGISVTIHMAKDSPKEDVTVFVVTTLSKNPSPLTNYLFQAVVPKGCKLKLQPPSSSELPAHNPFLPPSAITQIMLIANPNNVNLTLKCMISYTMEGETITEMGEVEKFITST